MHLLSILFSSLPSHVFSGNPILHNIFSLFQQCSAVQWFGQCSRMPVCLVFYYVVYGRPCPLLLYVLHVLRWQKIQNSVCFYLPYSFLYSSGVGNYKHKYMVIMPIIAIPFFWWRSLWMPPPFHFRVTHGFQAVAATRTGPLGPTFCSHESVLFLFSLTVNQLPISPPLLHST